MSDATPQTNESPKASANYSRWNRQTSVGVDIAEQTAAKTALQKAATELAERAQANARTKDPHVG